jgi:hypothetical protein
MAAPIRVAMDKQSRRDAVRDYKERKLSAGVFAVRCTATGQAWVGAARDLDQKQNGVWFGLKTGGHSNREMQAAWNAHGEAAFAYEPLEVLDSDGASRMGVEMMLKEAEARWRDQLGAGKVAG